MQSEMAVRPKHLFGEEDGQKSAIGLHGRGFGEL